MHPVLVHRPVSLLHPSFGPYLTATPLRFATLHLHQVGTGLSPVDAEHARRTSGTARPKLCRQAVETISSLAAGSGSRSSTPLARYAPVGMTRVVCGSRLGAL